MNASLSAPMDTIRIIPTTSAARVLPTASLAPTSLLVLSAAATTTSSYPMVQSAASATARICITLQLWLMELVNAALVELIAMLVWTDRLALNAC